MYGIYIRVLAVLHYVVKIITICVYLLIFEMLLESKVPQGKIKALRWKIKQA